MPLTHAVKIVSPTLPNAKLQELLDKTAPYAEGHFLYPADADGPRAHLAAFFYLAKWTSEPDAVSLTADDLVKWIAAKKIPVDVILAPGESSVKKVTERICESLNVPAAYLEYLPSGRFGETIKNAGALAGKNVLAFNGVSITGRCVGERLPAFAEKAGGTISAVSAFAKGTAAGVKAAEDRFGDRFYAAIQIDIPMYPPDPKKCPLCLEGFPLSPWNASSQTT